MTSTQTMKHGIFYYNANMNTKICAQCGEEIPFGEPYFKVGDNFLQLKYFETDELNRFCSQNCLCEYLSVIEIPNDGSPTLDELVFGLQR